MIDEKTLGDVAGSPNDLLLFFNHHTMIDCLFQPWLEHQPSALRISYSLANNFPLHLLVMTHSIARFHFSLPCTPMKTCLSIALNLVTHKRPFSDDTEPSTQSCKCNSNCLYTEHNMHLLQIHKQQHALTNG